MYMWYMHTYTQKNHWNGKGLKVKCLGNSLYPSICFRGGGWPGTNEDIITALERIAQLPESELSEPEYRDLGREVIISKSSISPRFCCSFADGWCFFFGKPPKIEVVTIQLQPLVRNICSLTVGHSYESAASNREGFGSNFSIGLFFLGGKGSFR